MKHLDLFSGIGGFSIASDEVFENVEHIFCEINPFCQKVLKKHWPQAAIYEDIKQLDTAAIGHVDLITGGFPCQPFSVAGKQKGKDDDRFLWPEMLRIIKECKPTWVIGENVAGIINLALEQVCSDLESAGYEVQPIIIPACAVDAPHRRDRVWIIAYAEGERTRGESGEVHRKNGRQNGVGVRYIKQSNKSNDWLEIASELCGVDDGLPIELDGFKLSKSKHRNERIKALGNAIVPQVAYQIIKYLNQFLCPQITNQESSGNTSVA